MEDDHDGFAIPKLSIKQNNSTASPPPPVILNMQNKKRKRDESIDKSEERNHHSKKPKLSVPASIYSPPSWAQLPPKQYKFELEVIKNGVSLSKIPLNRKTHFIFGRDRCADIVTLHPSCSRNHAVLQHRRDGQWLLFDFGSTHFTKLNHKKLHPHKYYKIDIGNLIQFGTSSRMYILNGPKELEQQREDAAEVETKPHIKPTQPVNKMQSIIQQLATQSKHHKTDSAQHQKPTLKVNVWGLDDSDSCGVPLNDTNFDENEAKEHIRTKDLYIELLSKRKQHNKIQNQLKQTQSKQRSDKPLTQTQCMKIEKLRKKVDALEDDIDGLSIKISNILRNAAVQTTDDSYYENDPFDDDDDYYDRIKKVTRRKHHTSGRHEIHHSHALNRNARYFEDKEPKLRDYDSYKDELEHLEMKISEIEQTLRDIEYRKRVNMKDKEKLEHKNHLIDEIVNDLKANDQKYKTLKRELEELQRRKATSVKMTNLLRPAYFKVMEKEPERVNRNKNKMKIYSPKKTPKEAVIKPGSLADIAQKMRTEEQQRKEYEEKIETEAKERLLEREEEIKQIESARVKAMKQFENEQKKTQEKRKLLRQRDEANKNKAGLIIYNKNEDKDGDHKKRALEKEFAKLIGTTSEINNEDDDHVQLTNPVDEMAFIREADGEFVPPSNQTGDGKTWLNEKYGY